MEIDEAEMEARAKKLVAEARGHKAEPTSPDADAEISLTKGADLYAQLDKDGDGNISAAEIAAASGMSMRGDDDGGGAGLACVVLSEERLNSLTTFLNEKMTADSTNEFYRNQVDVVNGAGRASDAKIASHYREDAAQRDTFYGLTTEACDDHYKKKTDIMEERLRVAIEQSEADLESRNRLAEENMTEKMERLERIRENNAAFFKQMKEEADLYNDDVDRMHKEVHTKMATVKEALEKAAKGRLPEEWLTGDWAWTPAASVSGTNVPTSPAGAGGAGDRPSTRGTTAGSLGTEREMATGNTWLDTASESAGTDQTGLTGTSRPSTRDKPFNAQALLDAAGPGVESGRDLEAEPDNAELKLIRELFDWADKDSNKYLSFAEFESLEMVCGRIIEEAEWAELCAGFDRDLTVGINPRDFGLLYPGRTAHDKQSKGVMIPTLLHQLEEDFRMVGIPFVVPQTTEQPELPGGGGGGGGRGPQGSYTEPLENTFPDPDMDRQAAKARARMMNSTAL